MRRILAFLAGGVFAALLIGGPIVFMTLKSRPVAEQENPAPEPKVVTAAPAQPTADPALPAARGRANEAWPAFLSLSSGADVRRIKLLAMLPSATGGEEEIWMTDCEAGGPADYLCLIEDTPSRPEVAPGDTYAVARNDIADWLVEMRNGRLHGGFTIRARLPQMEPTERARLLPRLAPLPRN